MRRWYVVNTKPHQEARAEFNLRRQAFEAWLPRFRNVRRRAQKLDAAVVPLFPGYLFARLDNDTKHWRSINSAASTAG